MARQRDNTAKTIVITLAVIGVLGVVCCGGGYFLWLKPGIDQLVLPTIELQKKLDSTALGPGAVFAPHQLGKQNEFVLLFGVGEDVELTPETLPELQDVAWRAYAEAYAAGGLPFAKTLAIGRTAPGSDPPVKGWLENTVTVEELEQRTGVKAPPPGMLDRFGTGESTEDGR